MNIYPALRLPMPPKKRIEKEPFLPWYLILIFGIVFGYLLGLAQQAAQHHHRQTCEICIEEAR